MKVKPTKILVFTGLIFTLLTAPAASAQKPDKQLTIYATVSNKKGEAVSDVKAEQFRLFEEGKEKQITSLSNENEPLTVGILLDVSSSMTRAWRKVDGKSVLRQCVADLINFSNKDNEYFIVTFGEKLNVIQELTRDHDELGKALNRAAEFRAQESTKLFDAVYSGLKKISEGSYRKKVLIVVSDGDDSDSLYNFAELRRAINDSNTLIYFVGMFANDDYVSFFGLSGKLFSNELARISGGKAFAAALKNSDEKKLKAEDVFSLLTQELQKQYAITFDVSPAGEKNKWHDIELKLSLTKDQEKSLGKLSVRTRSGYFPFSDEALSER